MSSENEIRRWLSFSRVRIDISRDQARGLTCDQTGSVTSFSDRFVTCRTVDNDRRSCQSLLNTRRNRRPDVFAYFRAYYKIRRLIILKQDLRPERNLFSVKLNPPHTVRSRSELTHLVKLSVIGKKCFRCKSDHFSIVDCRRRVIKFPAFCKRHSYKRQNVFAFCMPCNLFHCAVCRVQQNVLRKKISACISCYA